MLPCPDRLSLWIMTRSWSRKWWKPKDRRRDLVRAAALLIAEIERIDRAMLTTALNAGDTTDDKA